jgi:hypothetical protein
MKQGRKPTYKMLAGITHNNLLNIVDILVINNDSNTEIVNTLNHLFRIKPDRKVIVNWIMNAKLKIRNEPYKGLMAKWREEYADKPILITDEDTQLEVMFETAHNRGLI